MADSSQLIIFLTLVPTTLRQGDDGRSPWQFGWWWSVWISFFKTIFVKPCWGGWVVLSNMGDLCKICKKDGWLIETNSFTNSCFNNIATRRRRKKPLTIRMMMIACQRSQESELLSTSRLGPGWQNIQPIKRKIPWAEALKLVLLGLPGAVC